MREIDFTIEVDASLKVRLADGALLRIKPIVLNVLRTDGAEGSPDPAYRCNIAIQLFVEEPAKEGV